MDPPAAGTLLLGCAQDKIAVLDESGTYTYVNAAAERILGFESNELVGSDAFEYVHPTEREEVYERFEEVITSDGEYTADTATYRHRTADGSWVWLESRMSNLTDDALDGYVVGSREVTDRVEADRRRRESQERLAELARTTDDVLWMFSGDWSELLFCNPAYEAVYGMPVERLEADPANFLECIHPEDVPSVEAAMECLADGETVDMEYRVNPDRNYERWVWVQGEPIVENGDVVRIVGFARDVTDRRRRERQLAVMDNLLRHNVRSRTNEIVGYVELIEKAVETDVSDYVSVIRRAGDDLVESADKQREIVDLLTRPATPVELDLASEVKSALDTVETRYPGVEVGTSLPETLPVCALESIRGAVVELVENAVRHSPDEAPEIEVTATGQGDTAELVVRDDCPPIPEFDRGVLTGEHDSDAIYHSSGCGLWMVYWVVDLSEGAVAVDSAEAGNEVRISLPLKS